MRPIKLTFSGLHSYREEQKIDFQELGRMGIFGIFGPTGGGKSTILDAITLALYGNIERAPNGIRGIMNHMEDLLWVSFEFQLGECRYIAERSYKRTKKEDAIINKVSRLIQVMGEEMEVLADKATEVTSKVEDLLGMAFTDFTRAVIIPQNKFDEFLKLKDKDRTEMLEKIFCLEEYGEELTAKVKRLEKKLDGEYTSNKNIMLELGDASQEAVSKAQEELKEKGREVLQKRQQLKKLQEKLKEMEAAANIHQQMLDFMKQKKELEEKQPEIEKKKNQLDAARKAEGLKKPLEQVNLLKKQREEEEENLRKLTILEEENKKALENAEVRLKESEKDQQQLKHIREEELPKLPLAASYEKEIVALEKEEKELKDAILQGSHDLKKIEEELREKDQQTEELEKVINNLKVKNNKIQNIFYCRKEVDEGLLLLKTLEGEEKQLETALKQLEKRKKLLLAEEESFRKLISQELSLSLKDVEGEKIDNLMTLAEKHLQEAVDKEDRLQISLEKMKDQNMAKVLAEKLKEGEPCMVCGSLHHPKPADYGELIEEDTLILARKNLETAKTKVEALRKWYQDLHVQYNTYQERKKEIETNYEPVYLDGLRDFNRAKEEFQRAFMLLQQKIAEILPDFVLTDRNMVRILKKKLEDADEVYREVRKELDAKEELQRKLHKAISDLKGNHVNQQSKVKGQQENIEKTQNRLRALKEKKKALIGDISALVFERKIKEEILSLEKKILESQQFWEEANKKKQEIQQKIAALKSGIDKTTGYLRDMERELERSLREADFGSIAELEEALLEKEQQKALEEEIISFHNTYNHIEKSLAVLEEKVANQPFDHEEFQESKELYQRSEEEYNKAVKEEGGLQKNLATLLDKQKRWQELEEINQKILEKKDLVSTLFQLLRGKKFVKFLAEEHMRDMAIEASMRLGELTGQRYALALDDQCNFIMRDEYNNGMDRLVTSLSGGETFLTSLALALALSSKIQLKEKPLGFFFLDEGFGTLDNEKLELVMNTLEKLQRDQRMVGIISHVEELKNRMPRYIEVTPPQQNGKGSRVEIKYN